MTHAIGDLIDTARSREDCRVNPVAGQPVLPSGLELPPDLREFYASCGGLWFDWDVPIGIVPPDRFLSADAVILGEPSGKPRTARWFLIAESNDLGTAERVSIDLDPSRLGRCVNSFWDSYANPGSTDVLASSFTELLDRLLAYSAGEQGETMPYWLDEDFEPVGDAFDET